MKGWRRLCCYLGVLFGQAMPADLSARPPAIGQEVDIDSSVEAKALRRFNGIEEGEYRKYLQAIRLPRVSGEFRARARAALPKEGEVHLEGKAADELRDLGRVFEYHDRALDIQIKVIDVPQGVVAFYARCIILISEQALRLLTVPELHAIVAHEVGHDYVWQEYESAQSRGDYLKLRELELWCDGVSILTLLDLGLDPDSLMRALSKLTRFNKRFGTPADASEYPTDRTRAEFHKRLLDTRPLTTLCPRFDSRSGPWLLGCRMRRSRLARSRRGL